MLFTGIVLIIKGSINIFTVCVPAHVGQDIMWKIRQIVIEHARSVTEAVRRATVKVPGHVHPVAVDFI